MATVLAKPADQSTDDLDLVTAIRAGDDRAFEQLYTRYQAPIAAYVRGMVHDHGRAEDITQEVFMAALRRMRETDREINFKPWIYEIAKNACIDAFRRARNRSEVSFDAEDGLAPSDRGRLTAARSEAPDAVVDTKLALDDLCGAFGGLSQTHHDILVMREFEGLSYREIGERLGMSRAGVESTLFRARRKLGEEYEELVSGERCVRVRHIVDAPAGRTVGLRDQRRMARHISHCQPCRRYACLAGVDLAAVRAPASVAARIAALIPLPAFLRRRAGAEDAVPLLGHSGTPSFQWTSNVVSVLDPATVSGWSKAVATAASVAVAGLGAGAAVGEPEAFKRFVSQAPKVVGLAPSDRSAGDSTARPSPGSGRGAAPSSRAVGGKPGAASPAGAGAGAADAAGGRSGGAKPTGRDRLPTLQTGRTLPLPRLPGTSAIGEATDRLGKPETVVPGIDRSRDRVPADRPGDPKAPVDRVLEGARGEDRPAGQVVPAAPTPADVVPSVGEPAVPGSVGDGVEAVGESDAGTEASGVGVAAPVQGQGVAPVKGSVAPLKGVADGLSDVAGEALGAAGTGFR